MQVKQLPEMLTQHGLIFIGVQAEVRVELLMLLGLLLVELILNKEAQSLIMAWGKIKKGVRYEKVS